MVSSPHADNLTTRVAWMFSWRVSSPNLDPRLSFLCLNDKGGKGESLVSRLGVNTLHKIIHATRVARLSAWGLDTISKNDSSGITLGYEGFTLLTFIFPWKLSRVSVGFHGTALRSEKRSRKSYWEVGFFISFPSPLSVIAKSDQKPNSLMISMYNNKQTGEENKQNHQLNDVH